MARTLTWLHLSDLHARRRNDWDSRQITESLVLDLKAMQKNHGLRPDFIFFTGDVAFGAFDGEGMAEQYQLATKFFDAVRTAFTPEIPIRNLYLVPGNHDVDRGEITPDQTEWLRHPDRQLQEIIAAMRDGKKQWQTWMERLVNYRHFLTSYNLLHLTPDDPHLIWGDAQEINGIRVGIAGLNSAWSCANKEEKAKLWFGADWQIAQVKERMGPVDFAFALLHHPGNWFKGHEDPVAMRRMRQEFVIVLHGHEHQEWVEVDGENRLVISAGACYESSWMANGYSFGHIDLDQLQGSVRLCKWDSIGRGWVPRNIAGKTKDGLWTLPNLPWIKRSCDEAGVVGPIEPVSIDEDPQPALELSAEEHYTRRYCQHVIKQHDVLELFGCDIPRELQSHQLSVAYVSLNLAHEDQDEPLCPPPHAISETKPLAMRVKAKCDEERGEGIGNSSASIEFVLDEISDGTKRLLINGPAGAGKSTLMRWCAIHVAQQMLNEPSSLAPSFDDPASPKQLVARDRRNDETSPGDTCSWRHKIPFLIRLRDCPSGRLPAANELPHFLAKHLPSAPTNWMTDVLDSGQALVLFDGVDEIHRDHRRQLAEEIGELIQTYPKCVYVVTTRPGAVEPGWLSRLEFTEARVESMSRRDREEFIDKWYKSAALELKKRRPRPGENLTLTATRLKAELAEQRELGVLATNPLLCAMICALYRERQEKLPETPAELSEALCNMLLHRRERETPGLDGKHFLSTWRELQYPQKKGLLAELAWQMVSRGDSSIELATTRTLVAECLDSTPGRTKDEAADVVQALVERSGLLRPASDDRIDFLHNTLKEYLAAGRVVEMGNWKILADHADDPAWQPVILFALALAPEPFSSALVKQLLDQTATAEHTVQKTGTLTKKQRKELAIGKAQQFFLVRCRAAAKWLSAELSNTIDGFLKHLLPPASMNEVEALALLGPRILSYGTKSLEDGKWWSRQTCQMVARCLRLLRLVGGLRAKAIMKTIRRLPVNSSQVNNEWLLACCELFPEERLPWPVGSNEVITSLSLSSSAITDISRLDNLMSLAYLNLERTSVKDLSPLSKLTSIQYLFLNGWQVSDIQPLSGMIALKNLRCSFTQVNDLSPLTGLRALEALSLDWTPIADLTPLSSITSLNRLGLRGTKISDLSPLAELPVLEYLDLERTNVTDLEPLKGIPSLKQLDLRETKVSDLTPLVELVSLQHLDLVGTSVTDLSPLAGLPALEDLDLRRTPVTDLKPLSGIASLKQLRLEDTKVSDLSPLAWLHALEDLDLGGAPVTDLEPLSGMTSLRWLSLRNTTMIDLSPLSKLASLKYINLVKTTTNKQMLDNFISLRPDVAISSP